MTDTELVLWLQSVKLGPDITSCQTKISCQAEFDVIEKGKKGGKERKGEKERREATLQTEQ